MTDPKPLFAYSLTPETIPTGGPGHGAVTLTISVANEKGEEQACRQIAFTLPPQLRGSGIALSTTSDTWALTADSTQPGVYLAEPQDVTTGLGAKERVGFVFGGVEPASTPGPATIEITEETREVRKGQLDATLVQGGPAITKFTADRLYVAPAAEVTFSWSAEGADGVMLDWGEGSHSGEPSGSFTVEPEATIVATLTAFASGGAKRTGQLTVTVERPQVLSFDVEPKYVVPGTPVSLSWKTLFAERTTLELLRSGEKSSAASTEVPPNATNYPQTVPWSGTFNLQAVNGTDTDSRQQPVVACVAPLLTLLGVECPWAENPRVSWEVKGAERATLTNKLVEPPVTTPIDPEKGSVSPPVDLSNQILCELTFFSDIYGVTSVEIGCGGSSYLAFGWTLESPQGLNTPGGQITMFWGGKTNDSGLTLEGELVTEGVQRTPLLGLQPPFAFTLPQSPLPGSWGSDLWTGRLEHKPEPSAIDAFANWAIQKNTMDPPSLQSDQKKETS